MSRHRNRFGGVEGSAAFRDWAGSTHTVKQAWSGAFRGDEKPARSMASGPDGRVEQLLREGRGEEVEAMGKSAFHPLAKILVGRHMYHYQTRKPLSPEPDVFDENLHKGAARALMRLPPMGFDDQGEQDLLRRARLHAALAILDEDKIYAEGTMDALWQEDHSGTFHGLVQGSSCMQTNAMRINCAVELARYFERQPVRGGDIEPMLEGVVQAAASIAKTSGEKVKVCRAAGALGHTGRHFQKRYLGEMAGDPDAKVRNAALEAVEHMERAWYNFG